MVASMVLSASAADDAATCSAKFVTRAQRFPKRSAWSVSSAWSWRRRQQTTAVVRDAPPSAARRRQESFDSRYGTWARPSTSAAMTFPSTIKLPLMATASPHRVASFIAPDL